MEPLVPWRLSPGRRAPDRPVSIATPLVLVLGTGIGLRVASILCVGLAVEGAYRLAWLWFREPWAAAAAALVYGLNGGCP